MGLINWLQLAKEACPSGLFRGIAVEQDPDGRWEATVKLHGLSGAGVTASGPTPNEAMREAIRLVKLCVEKGVLP